jgi:CAAX prenyl protease-like protein
MVLPVTAWAYAVRTAATAAVGVWCLWKGRSGKSAASPNWPRQARPSRLGEAALSPLRLLGGLLVGILVTVLWIVPEISPFYRTWFCWPLGSLPAATTAPSPYDPAVCGWTLTVAKLVGSAFVIAPVEEVFFRSFLYRWLQKRDFLSIPLARFNLSAFLWMVFLFTLEHDRPLAAALAGAAYGFAAIRWGLASAIIAHVTTNLLLGLHVIYHNAWQFW